MTFNSTKNATNAPKSHAFRAILIDPVRRLIEPHTIDGRLASLQAAVGGAIAWGTELKTGDVLYVDDEGLLKRNPAFFSLGKRSFAGRGLLVGPENPLITDVISSVDEVTAMVGFNVCLDIEKSMAVKCTTFDSADAFFEYLRRQREAGHS
jgi:Domain of unknown function (DUF3846)